MQNDVKPLQYHLEVAFLCAMKLSHFDVYGGLNFNFNFYKIPRLLL